MIILAFSRREEFMGMLSVDRCMYASRLADML